MIKEIVFATNNSHKLEEIRKIVGNKFRILSLNEINCHDDIVEDGATLTENALIKARFVKENYGYDCFADDTGLMIDALNGDPGVYSARFAGEECDSERNIDKVLNLMGDTQKRSARFVTVIALILDGKEILFEGKVEGNILTKREGNSGFGYDPVFEPENRGKSFAQMSADEKNIISHRGRATEKLVDYLKTI